MGSDQSVRFGYDVRARSCRSLAVLLAVMVFAAAAGWLSNAAVAAKQKPQKKSEKTDTQAVQSAAVAKTAKSGAAKPGRAKNRPGNDLDEAVLRYLPDDCEMFGWVDVGMFLESEVGQKLKRESAEFWTGIQEQFTPLGLEAEQIERIVFGAQSISNDEMEKAVAILFCKQPVEPSAFISKAGQWAMEKIDRFTVWVKAGEEPSALCAVEDNIVLLADPEPMRAVLARQEAIKLPETLDRSRRMLDSSAGLAATFLPSDSGDMASLPFPIADSFLGQVEAVNVEVSFEADLAVRLTAVCGNEVAAQQLNGLATGLWALVQMQNLNNQEPGVRELVRSVRFETDGALVTASMKLPTSYVKFGDSKTKLAASNKLLAPAGGLVPSYPPFAQASPGTTPTYCAGNNQFFPTTAAAVPPPYCPTGPYAPTPYNPGGTVYTPFDPYAPTPDPCQPLLTLQIADVIRLVGAGVDEEVVIRHVGKRQLPAALTVDDLILLTESEVSKQIITALQGLPVVPKPTPSQTYKSPVGQAYPPYNPGTPQKPLPYSQAQGPYDR